MGEHVFESAFWSGKRVFLTGHTGFKGGWLSILLWSLGARVMGFALPPPDGQSLFVEGRLDEILLSRIGDVRDLDYLKACIDEFQPDIVLHLAAQPLVRASYEDPTYTFSTNIMGTVNLLRALDGVSSVRAVVNVTTDKCYENDYRKVPYAESDRLGGHDPYSASKACSEIVSSSMYRSFLSSQNVMMATARAGNVIGGGDWSKDRLVPDAIAAFERGEAVTLRNPMHTRPWQHVLEPLHGYLLLARALFERGTDFCGAWNFGPHNSDVHPVYQVVELMASRWGLELGWMTDNTLQPHESFDLSLDISKAESHLGWSPRWDLQTAIDRIVQWQKSWRAGSSARALCLDQIHSFFDLPPVGEVRA